MGAIATTFGYVCKEVISLCTFNIVSFQYGRIFFHKQLNFKTHLLRGYELEKFKKIYDDKRFLNTYDSLNSNQISMVCKASNSS